MRLAAWSLVLAACGGTPAPLPPTIQGQSDPPPAARATPAPTIGWTDSHFDVHGLPAVARAGEVAAMAVTDSDGGRGYPNLRIEVRDRNDKLLQTIPVMTANEFETLAPGGTPGPALRQRIAAANRALATVHGLHDLVPMHALEVQPPADGGLRHLAMGDGLDVDFAGDHLSVLVHDTDRALASRPAGGWQIGPHKACAQCMTCENPAFLDGAYHATGIQVVVVQIGYMGTDTCWEPGDQHHVVSW